MKKVVELIVILIIKMVVIHILLGKVKTIIIVGNLLTIIDLKVIVIVILQQEKFKVMEGVI